MLWCDYKPIYLLIIYLLIYIVNYYQWASCLHCRTPAKKPMELAIINNFHNRRPHEEIEHGSLHYWTKYIIKFWAENNPSSLYRHYLIIHTVATSWYYKMLLTNNVKSFENQVIISYLFVSFSIILSIHNIKWMICHK